MNAKTPYSAAKAAGDQMVRAYMQTYPEMNLQMTHCANNYGPFQLPEKLTTLAVKRAAREEATGLRRRVAEPGLAACGRPLCRSAQSATRRAGPRPRRGGDRPGAAADLRRVRPVRGHQ
ncbi:NAD-dependent epimerase/dehydratase family protein [Nocardia abscessus]|uniref:NAD-dependent epimerase/dehydratase family protein n=1 Tax=Nocardia abscessus TaxID=120957 RepID=A0ABS0C9U8_9NOCA|nr:NAD-dependent epimerase/dehydratase family protein [Nocardia abscessus]